VASKLKKSSPLFQRTVYLIVSHAQGLLPLSYLNRLVGKLDSPLEICLIFALSLELIQLYLIQQYS
jgi:hypothetical protein